MYFNNLITQFKRNKTFKGLITPFTKCMQGFKSPLLCETHCFLGTASSDPSASHQTLQILMGLSLSNVTYCHAILPLLHTLLYLFIYLFIYLCVLLCFLWLWFASSEIWDFFKKILFFFPLECLEMLV